MHTRFKGDNVIRIRALAVSIILAVGVAGSSLWLGAFLQNKYDFFDSISPERLSSKALELAPSAKKTKPVKRGAGKPMPYSGKLPSLASVNIRDAVLEKVAGGFKYPWAMELLPNQALLITEFSGKMKILHLADKTTETVSGLPDIPSGRGQIGLMDVVLHPDFKENHLIYFSHAVRSEGEEELYATAVSRAELHGTELRALKRIFVATPYGKSPSNFGGVLAFDTAGYLYIGTGDRSQRNDSQNPKSLRGKILRLQDDGGTPADNPFLDDPETDDRIYALGVRNPQGLVFDPVSGDLYEAEHGPMGGDEVNLVLPGGNYGWPRITYGSNYTTQKIGVGTAEAGLEQPLYYYLPSLAISPLEIYRGTMFPEWEGDLLVGALKAAHINKLDLVDGAILSEHRILTELNDRVRDIKVSSDGSVYILVQNHGRVYRLYRNPAGKGLETPKLRSGKNTYELVCASCHSTGLSQIPQIDDPSQWVARLSQGAEVLYSHSIDGFRGMPAKGLCEGCLDKEIKSAVDYMLRELQKASKK
ncbi:MAG: glucose/arabinose dehydrogenase [Halioglobus sp.]